MIFMLEQTSFSMIYSNYFNPTNVNCVLTQSTIDKSMRSQLLAGELSPNKPNNITNQILITIVKTVLSNVQK